MSWHITLFWFIEPNNWYQSGQFYVNSPWLMATDWRTLKSYSKKMISKSMSCLIYSTEVTWFSNFFFIWETWQTEWILECIGNCNLQATCPIFATIWNGPWYIGTLLRVLGSRNRKRRRKWNIQEEYSSWSYPNNFIHKGQEQLIICNSHNLSSKTTTHCLLNDQIFSSNEHYLTHHLN